jgi:glutamate-1-semialdehyde 2,1-aminomutase
LEAVVWAIQADIQKIGESVIVRINMRGKGKNSSLTPERINMNKSQEWTERLQKVIPWGSSTCSKTPHLAPEEPGVIVRGKGCRVWDADGREFIDYRFGLGPVTLGYQFPEVDDAIRSQLEQGIVFGHPHPLECEVAEMLCEIIPCSEMVRFLKTGGEANAACIRLARYYTGREHIIQIGYNGWLNSLGSGTKTLPGQMARTSPPGVPLCQSMLHHACDWNDLETLNRLFDEYDGKIAAVMVAADYSDMEAGRTFYPELRRITEKHGSLLIYDEIVTGFRVAIGGVQEYFNVTPDLAVFGKAIANGMPLSVFLGRRDIMQKCEKGGVIVSSTFGGETLSLAAAKASISVYRKHNVTGHLWKQGEKLWTGLNNLFVSHNIPLEVKGFHPCPAFIARCGAGHDLVDSFLRAAYKNGVSLYNVSYVTFSHKDGDIEETLQRLDKACSSLKLY